MARVKDEILYIISVRVAANHPPVTGRVVYTGGNENVDQTPPPPSIIFLFFRSLYSIPLVPSSVPLQAFPINRDAPVNKPVCRTVSFSSNWFKYILSTIISFILYNQRFCILYNQRVVLYIYLEDDSSSRRINF